MRTAAADGPSVDAQAAPDGHGTGDGSEAVPSRDALQIGAEWEKSACGGMQLTW
jgi:hypothetical protein